MMDEERTVSVGELSEASNDNSGAQLDFILLLSEAHARPPLLSC